MTNEKIQTAHQIPFSCLPYEDILEFCANDDSRPILNHVMVAPAPGDGSFVAAGDGFRMFMLRKPFDTEKPFVVDRRLTLPSLGKSQDYDYAFGTDALLQFDGTIQPVDFVGLLNGCQGYQLAFTADWYAIAELAKTLTASQRRKYNRRGIASAIRLPNGRNEDTRIAVDFSSGDLGDYDGYRIEVLPAAIDCQEAEDLTEILLGDQDVTPDSAIVYINTVLLASSIDIIGNYPTYPAGFDRYKKRTIPRFIFSLYVRPNPDYQNAPIALVPHSYNHFRMVSRADIPTELDVSAVDHLLLMMPMNFRESVVTRHIPW